MSLINRTNRTFIPLLIINLLLLPHGVEADTATMSQTKAKLKQLEAKINNLQHTLSSAHDKNSLLNQELSQTEKKISIGVHQLNLAREDKEQKQRKITELQQQVNTLNSQLRTQQELLAKHIRARYSMGEYQPLKWILNQDDPHTTSRMLTFYQYIVQSRQQMIDKVQLTKKNLLNSQDQLHIEIEKQKQLQEQLNIHQQKLEQDKLYHTEIIRSLNKDIHSNQQALEDYQRNKNNLSNILKSLTQQSVIQTQHPFVFMHKKLPRPVGEKGTIIQNMNQGVILYANEGSPVTSVYYGKIVFSDWLKGYGLLLIIDHGQGFMTLYAHNQSLFKKKGEVAEQGEQIATIGHTGGLKQNGLYFEIRQRGKAIPPLKWLS